MKIDKTPMKIQRVEIIQRVFNQQNQIVREQIEYYLPEEDQAVVIGFKAKSSKKKL